jgi:hypothetical protein
MQLDLTDDEVRLLIRLLRRAIDDDRYPMAPRLAPLKALLAKLQPPKAAQPLPHHRRRGCGAEPRALSPTAMTLPRIEPIIPMSRFDEFGGPSPSTGCAI